jgi:hypothetical protein
LGGISALVRRRRLLLLAEQKQNEIHYEIGTHFIRLTLSKVET